MLIICGTSRARFRAFGSSAGAARSTDESARFSFRMTMVVVLGITLAVYHKVQPLPLRHCGRPGLRREHLRREHAYRRRAAASRSRRGDAAPGGSRTTRRGAGEGDSAPRARGCSKTACVRCVAVLITCTNGVMPLDCTLFVLF